MLTQVHQPSSLPVPLHRGQVVAVGGEPQWQGELSEGLFWGVDFFFILVSGTRLSRFGVLNSMLLPSEKGGFAILMVRMDRGTHGKLPIPLALNFLAFKGHLHFYGPLLSALCSHPPFIGTSARPLGLDLTWGSAGDGPWKGADHAMEAWHCLGTAWLCPCQRSRPPS